METATLKPVYKLSSMWEKAKTAHYFTSHTPEIRADQAIKEYSELLESDLKLMPEEFKTGYETKFKELLSAYFVSRSRCASTMITGGSNFNVRQNEKHNNWADAKYTAFEEFREKAQKSIKRQVLGARSSEEVEDDLYTQASKKIIGHAEFIARIDSGDTGARGYSRPLFVKGITGTLETIAKNGNVSLLDRLLVLLGELNEGAKKKIVTANHSVWKLKEFATAVSAQKTEDQEKENEEIPFTGGKVVLNTTIDRIQLIYDAKPDGNVIDVLKRNAFKWSPTNLAWQRKNTYNTKQAINTVLGIKIF